MEKTIYKKVTCPICIETLKQPIKMLSCGHSFCHRCIERHCKSSRQSRYNFCFKVYFWIDLVRLFTNNKKITSNSNSTFWKNSKLGSFNYIQPIYLSHLLQFYRTFCDFEQSFRDPAALYCDGILLEMNRKFGKKASPVALRRLASRQT